ncbi:hypothetical protein MXD62_20070 [Frankia sp. Mgl5]|uniref:hypothetical protein n=1 Tax=Frankia sp. Mgl5 TaxID=2933793 RepID=UPI00200D7472|nr:hypothetical protein [Frankia sp. Mgl5]MCK9929448.1 hypothetical protein [Frankia sp. Mgl5]
MTAQPHHGTGHITNSADPGWCVYCGAAIPLPPAWDWPAARAEVIVRAAETARRQHQDRRRQAEQQAAWRRLDALVTWATSAATWARIARRITAA